jgi:hypothetical protein
MDLGFEGEGSWEREKILEVGPELPLSKNEKDPLSPLSL